VRWIWNLATLATMTTVVWAAPLVAKASAQVVAAPDPFNISDLPDFRVFLVDGVSLVSYGEPTRVGDRIVFSMPTSASGVDPRLQLVNIGASHVDWERTREYTESVRGARYVATHAEESYATLAVEIGQAINDLALTTDAAERLRIVERARRTLAEWPARHFNYRQDDIRQMVAVLDEAIADLRAAAGIDQFDLTFVANVQPPPSRALLPRATVREAIDQTLVAARLSETSVERVSLMAAALISVERDARDLPAAWRRELRSDLRDAIAAEQRVDRQYQSLTTRVRDQSTERARNADVRGLERLLADVVRQDAALGGKRPDVMDALVSSVRGDLDAARQLQLDRDRWAARLPELRRYHAALSVPAERLRTITDELQDVRDLSGSSPAALSAIQGVATQALAIVAMLAPPEELRAVHALVTGAAEMAERAARLRREAAMDANLTRAWDASSAAAGALLLVTRATAEMSTVLKPPQLPR
jgi:hypothetical protein